jgi:hypothetical protein
MIEKAKGAGLSFEEDYIQEQVKPNVKGEIYNSNGLPFSLLGQFVRKISQKPRTNESLHPSVLQRADAGIDYKYEL